MAINQNALHTEGGDSQRSLEELISTAYKQDPTPFKIMEAIRRGDCQLPPDLARSKISLSAFSAREGRLYVGERLFVPKDDALRLRLLQSHNDNVAAG
jgi:hypothetical protein